MTPPSKKSKKNHQNHKRIYTYTHIHTYIHKMRKTDEEEEEVKNNGGGAGGGGNGGGADVANKGGGGTTSATTDEDTDEDTTTKKKKKRQLMIVIGVVVVISLAIIIPVAIKKSRNNDDEETNQWKYYGYIKDAVDDDDDGGRARGVGVESLLDLSAGDEHSCAVRRRSSTTNDDQSLSSSSLFCWGNSGITIPYDLQTAKNIKQVVTGEETTCVIIIDDASDTIKTSDTSNASDASSASAGDAGRMECFGDFDFLNNEIEPPDDLGLVSHISMAGKHTCVVLQEPSSSSTTADASGVTTTTTTVLPNLRCWGYNGYTFVEDEPFPDDLVVVDEETNGGGVLGVGVVTYVDVGNNERDPTCAIVNYPESDNNTSKVKCWKYVDEFVGAEFDDDVAPVPDEVNNNNADGGGTTILSLSVSERVTCAIVAATTTEDDNNGTGGGGGGGGGTIHCWYNKLTNNRDNPMLAVPDGNDFIQIDLSQFEACAVRADYTLVCFELETFGEDDVVKYKSIPRPLTVLGVGKIVVSKVSAGRTHFCATTSHSLPRDDDGTTILGICWSDNKNYHYNPNMLLSYPLEQDIQHAKVVAAGFHNTCIIEASTTSGVQCWGTSSSADELQLPTGVGYSNIFLKHDYLCGIPAGDPSTVVCNGFPDGAYNPPEGLIPTGSIIVDVDIKDYSPKFGACAIITTNDGTTNDVVCWGEEGGDDGDDNDTLDFIPPTDAPEFQSLYLSSYHFCGRTKSTQEVYCWTTPDDDLVRDDGTHFRPASIVPNELVGVAVKDVAVGLFHTCAIVDGTGEVRCWGESNENATNTNSMYVLDPPVGIQFESITATDYETCGIITTSANDESGTNNIVCWGRPFISAMYPPVGIGKAIQITSGVGHFCVVTENEMEVHCWGSNTFGELAMEYTEGEIFN